jgi:hypothetical protein
MSDIGIFDVIGVLAVIGVYVLIVALTIGLLRFIGSRWRRRSGRSEAERR